MRSIKDIREYLANIIFKSDTTLGKIVDIVLQIVTLLSVAAVTIESLPELYLNLGNWEISFTIFFTVEFILRLWTSPSWKTYLFSFSGFIDIISIAPTYISLLNATGGSYLSLRLLRFLRIFRLFKITQFSNEWDQIVGALKQSIYKITVFLYAVVILVFILGALIYAVEGEENGFTSIPTGVYWAVVTITTVGYGDITPSTSLGKFISATAMLIGYAIIAVPTGIVTASYLNRRDERESGCPRCMQKYNNNDETNYCSRCGFALFEVKSFDESKNTV